MQSWLDWSSHVNRMSVKMEVLVRCEVLKAMMIDDGGGGGRR